MADSLLAVCGWDLQACDRQLRDDAGPRRRLPSTRSLTLAGPDMVVAGTDIDAPVPTRLIRPFS